MKTVDVAGTVGREVFNSYARSPAGRVGGIDALRRASATCCGAFSTAAECALAEGGDARVPTSGGELLAAIRARVRNVAFGYDFFISYRSADGSNYARSLHAALERRGFECFLDLQFYEAGHNLPVMQTRALKLSTKLLVVVSPRAHAPPPTGVGAGVDPHLFAGEDAVLVRSWSWTDEVQKAP